MDDCQEYLRRNLLHCKSIGAHGIAVSALKRLRGMKCPPLWIVQAFEGVRDRAAELPAEMAAWRNSAPDNPYNTKPASEPVQDAASVEGLLELVDKHGRLRWGCGVSQAFRNPTEAKSKDQEAVELREAIRAYAQRLKEGK